MTTLRAVLDMLLALRGLRRRETWPRHRLEKHRSAMLTRLRAHAYTRSPFYREFHGGLTERPLHELPVLTKSMLYDHFDEIVTDPFVTRANAADHVQSLTGAERFRGEYIVNTSSGTSGSAGFSLFNRSEWATVLASFARFERHIGSGRGMVTRPKMAVVASSAPWHMSARVGATVRSSWMPMLRLDVGEPLEVIVQELNAYQPQVLVSYASMAGVLADEQKAGRLQIAPRRIVCTAEVLSPPLRRRIQAIWGDVVFNQYGASEGGVLAMECESPLRVSGDAETGRRGLHLFEDLHIFEVVDEQNRAVPAGQYGDKVLLTVLFNHSLPLIRYELRDRVRISPAPCSCGRTFLLIDDIQGRHENLMRFPHRDNTTVTVHPMIFYRIFDALPVRDWQVTQDGNRLTIRLSGGKDTVDEPALIQAVHEALARQNAVAPHITVEWLSHLQKGPTQKAIRLLPDQAQ